MLHYLGRYTHRVAISNHRLVSFADGKVTFRWRDSAHHNEQKLLTLSLDEFLRRFLLHVLPEGFVRIRNFGFLANRRRATSCHFAFISSAQRRRPSKRPHPPVSFGYAPNAVDRCRSSKGLRLLKSSFVLLPSWSPLPHETTLHSTEPLCASARSSFSALPPNGFLLSRFSIVSVCVRPLFCHLLPTRWCSLRFAAQLRRISTPYLPSIEFA